jgi:hypothetical protein
MISLEDCIGLCGLDEDEVAAISEHEHIPEIAAAALANYLLTQPHGGETIRTMIAGLLAFMVVLQSAAWAQETYRINPEDYTGHIEETIPKNSPNRKWLGYYLAENHTPAAEHGVYQDLRQHKFLNPPPHIMKLIEARKVEYEKLGWLGGSHPPKTMTSPKGSDPRMLMKEQQPLRDLIITDVNDFVNNSIQPREISHALRTPEQIFTETVQKTDGKYSYYGDSKDFVIAKMSILERFGIDDTTPVVGVLDVKGSPGGYPDGTYGHVLLGVFRGEDPPTRRFRDPTSLYGEELDNWVFLDSNKPTLKNEGWIVNPLRQPNGFKFIPLVMVDSTGTYNLIRYKVDPEHLFEQWTKTSPYGKYFSEPLSENDNPFKNSPQRRLDLQRKLDELRDQATRHEQELKDDLQRQMDRIKQLQQRPRQEFKQRTEPGPWEKQRDEIWNKRMREMKEQQDQKPSSLERSR